MANNRLSFNQNDMPSQLTGMFGLYGNQSLVIERAVSQLLQHIAYGEQDQAEAMLNVNPELLRLRGNTRDYAGHLFENVTAFQLALRAHDVDMWTMLEKYIDQLPNGQHEKLTLFTAEFPCGIPSAQTPYDFSLLVDAINQLSDSDDRLISEILTTFRADFDTCSLNEQHFNPQHLLTAFAVYNANFIQWNWDQRDIFAIRVIGYVERYLPACYAQAFSQGLSTIANYHEPLRRSLMFKDKQASYFPISFDSQKGLGFDHVIFSDISAGTMPRLWTVDTGSFERLCAMKVSELNALKSRIDAVAESEPLCRVC